MDRKVYCSSTNGSCGFNVDLVDACTRWSACVVPANGIQQPPSIDTHILRRKAVIRQVSRLGEVSALLLQQDGQDVGLDEVQVDAETLLNRCGTRTKAGRL